MENNQNTKKNKRNLLDVTFHSTIDPGRMERVKVDTYNIKDTPPKFDIKYEPIIIENKDVICKPIELVDLNDMTYELVYSCQKFSDRRVRVLFKWRGGQVPAHPRLKT